MAARGFGFNGSAATGANGNSKGARNRRKALKRRSSEAMRGSLRKIGVVGAGPYKGWNNRDDWFTRW